MAGTTRTVPVGEMQTGDHLCLPYASDAETQQVLAAFVRDGIAAGDMVLYLADATTRETVLAFLRRHGIDPAPDGVNVKLAAEAYLVGGCFDPDRMVDRIRAAVEEATAKGYRRLRITSETNWALGDVPGADRLGEYEAKVQQVLDTSPAMAICQYDARLFAPQALAALERVHSGRVTPNPVLEHGQGSIVLDVHACPDSARELLRIARTTRPQGLRLSGDVDFVTYGLLEQALASIAHGGDIHLDLAQVGFIDMAGTRLLATTAARLRPGRRLVLRAPPPQMARVLKLTGWDQVANLVVQEVGDHGRT